MSISNNQLRKMKSAARLYAVQALFQMEASGQMVDQIIREEKGTAATKRMLLLINSKYNDAKKGLCLVYS